MIIRDKVGVAKRFLVRKLKMPTLAVVSLFEIQPESLFKLGAHLRQSYLNKATNCRIVIVINSGQTSA